ncbi:MAG TPA: SpoIVB peptidase S55 domain-containing protein [Candidatus Eisenbacteria bacterium]|nr:SpoIVB peptidase S55 domain-containing protein [Candidatus Eisenbacteria bacterium]
MTRRLGSLAARALLLAALASGLAPHAAHAAARRTGVPVLPVDSVRAGMVGIGYTVFQGTRVDTFSVSILGVLRAYRPGASLIMAKAMNPTLEKTGIIAGMSGSPIYVNGRLIGALSYTWGFLKEPLAGITPIEEMLDILPGPAGRPKNADSDDDRLGSLGPGLGLDAPGRDDAVATGGGGARAQASLADAMRPIGTPVILSGYTPEAIRFLEPYFRDRGLIAVHGGAPSGDGDCDSLRPGSAVGVQLVSGDWNAAAIGTVTYRDQDRLLAFGHPFTAMGWVDFPMTTAEILTIMSSNQISNKMGSAARPCGTLIADRQAGILGDVGDVPAMIPVRVDIRGAGGRRQEFHFGVVRNRLLTPGLVSSAVVSSISSLLNDTGLCTVRYEFTSFWNAGTRRLTRGDAILSSSPVAGVGEEIGQSLQLLLGDRFRPSRLDSAVVSIDVAEGIEATALTGIRTSTTTAAPGETIEIEATFRSSSRDTETRRYAIRVPPSAPEGDLTIRVCDGDETERWERGRAPQRYEPRTFDDLMRLYAEERRADHLYLQLYAAANGTVRDGREIARAPASFLSVLDGGTKKGEEAPVKGATLAEQAVPFGRVVRGCETITITVAADRRR